MGKALIINGANFRSNAVEHLIMEPTEFYNISGVGTSASFELGQYFINTNYPDRVMLKTNDSSTEITDACFVKYLNSNFYMKLNPNRGSNLKFEPWYNLDELNAEIVKGQLAQVENSKLTFIDNSGFDIMKVSVKSGDSITWAAYGASDACAIYVSGETAKVISTGYNIGNVVFKNTTGKDVLVYINDASIQGYFWVSRIES